MTATASLPLMRDSLDDVPDEKTRGEKVRQRRQALDLTQEELAIAAEVSAETVRNLESDKSDNMRKAGRILKALDEIEIQRGGGPTFSAGAAKVARVIGHREVPGDARIAFTQDERVQVLTFFVSDPGMSQEEIDAAIKEWRRNRSNDQ